MQNTMLIRIAAVIVAVNSLFLRLCHESVLKTVKFKIRLCSYYVIGISFNGFNLEY